MIITRIHFDMITYANRGHRQHPHSRFHALLDIWRKRQGIKVISETAHPIGDCWIFELGSSLDAHFTPFPKYLKVIPPDNSKNTDKVEIAPSGPTQVKGTIESLYIDGKKFVVAPCDALELPVGFSAFKKEPSQ
jgi:hypothetical protein